MRRNARFALLAERYERDVLPQLVDQRRYWIVRDKLGHWAEEHKIYDIGEYAVWRAHAGASNATIRREVGVLMAVLHHARRTGLIDKIPAPPRIPTKSTAQGLMPEEIGEIIERAQSHKLLHAFVTVALNTGARPSAILGLTWDRINLINNTIDFNDPSMGKLARRKSRAIVPINSGLGEYLKSLPRTGPRLLPVRNINVLWRRHIGFSRPHDLRHTVATEIARRFGLLAAASILGHRSVKTTEQVYVHIRADHLREQAETLGKYHVDRR